MSPYDDPHVSAGEIADYLHSQKPISMTELQVKERPILFSGAMVRALLAGTKTQTRRAIKPQPVIDEDSGYVYDGKHKHAYKNDALHTPWQEGFTRDLCPYGQPGDRLWVRENFQAFVPGTWAMVMKLDQNCVTAFQATESERAAEFNDNPWAGPWRPSIHMPRRLSRVLLEITSVRVEKLKDISEGDAKAEGYSGYQDYYDMLDDEDKEAFMLLEEDHDAYAKRKGFTYPQAWYRMLWDKINGYGAYFLNPWVWVVEFQVVQPGR